MKKFAMVAVASIAFIGCGVPDSVKPEIDTDDLQIAKKQAALGGGRVQIQPYALVPPLCWTNQPIECPVWATDKNKGFDLLVRGDDRMLNVVSIKEEITPGHVYVYAVVPFNHPEECNLIEDRFLGIQYPCRAEGPLNRLDGNNPATGFYVAAFEGKVATRDKIAFVQDPVNDTPTDVLIGNGITNPRGAMFYNGVMDKGPELPVSHPQHILQRTTIKGGCQGPPFFGPYPCRWVHVAAHAPN